MTATQTAVQTPAPVAEFHRKRQAAIEGYASDQQFKDLTAQWMSAAFQRQYMYNFSFLGRPVIQTPADMVGMQELIWDVRPDLIIETGIAHGGSLIMSAAMLSILDYCDAVENQTLLDPQKPARKVLGIDIDIRSHNRAAVETHPMASRIVMIQGSSVDPSTIEKVHQYAAQYSRILVCLDSNHTHDHVLAELHAYAPLTTVGSYCVVFDTIVEDLPHSFFPDRPWKPGDNPKTAVWEYLKTHDEFETDVSMHQKLQTTVSPDGFLKRVR